jgi:fatty-acyl-CoA synthase
MYEVSLTESYFPAQIDDEIFETTVGDVLRSAAATAPDQEGLVEITMEAESARRWTYAEFLAEAEQVGRWLAGQFKPGERIAVWSPNTPEWVIMEFGAAFAGLTLVTVNPAFQPNELKYVMAQSKSVALFLTPEFRGNPMQKYADQVKGDLPNLRVLYDIDQLLTLVADTPDNAPLPKVTPDDPVQIQYTSGTTGFPKGAVLCHRSVTNNARMAAKRLGGGQGDVWLNFMPLFHTGGCVLGVLGSIQTGCTLAIAKMFTPGGMNAVIERERVSFLLGVPTMIVGMIESQEATPVDLSSIRTAMAGGSMVPPELVRQIKAVFGCDFETIYGQTETSPTLTLSHADDAINDLCNTVGQPLPCTEISIRDPKTNKITAIDEVGEICARGYCNMIEYNDNPKATAETIDNEGWLHTGDLGAMDTRGYVRVTGRVKEMIIRGGENMFPAEIENIMLEHGQVAEVAVVGIPDDKWGEIIACFIRATGGEAPAIGDLVAHCRTHLSPQKTPAHWIFIDEWPLTGSGKIQKFVLRDQFVAGERTPATA